ncbi:MAG: rod shape-determining protein MreC [Clostridiales bacterium]
MRYRRNNSVKAGLLITAAVFVLLLIATLTALEREQLTFGEELVRDMVAPLQSGVVVIGEKLAQIPRFFSDMQTLNAENHQLTAQVAAITARLSQVEAYEQENQRLRRLLNLAQEMAQWQPVAAQVIGRDIDHWYDTITIRGGADQRFARDQAVITADGLVGRIISVSHRSAQVLLLTDVDTALSCMIEESRVAGVLEAADDLGNLHMIHLPADQPVKKQQTVITSGYGGIYPYGLRIGFIGQVQEAQGGLTQEAIIQPYVDFSKLETVLVLVASTPQDPLAAAETVLPGSVASGEEHR